MTIQHKALAAGRWEKMSLSEQMANIGSEVERAISWKNKNNREYSIKAIERALELIDLSLSCIKRSSHLKEIARLREALVDFFYGPNDFKSTDILWHNYFTPFIYAARKR